MPENEYIVWDDQDFDRAVRQRKKRRTPLIGVVDDDGAVRDFVKAVLGSKYTVVTASGGAEGLSMYNREAPDLLLLDIDMPNVTGMEALAALHMHDPKGRIVMLTSHNTEKKVMEAKKLGVIGYIIKPLTETMLLEYVGARL